MRSAAQLYSRTWVAALNGADTDDLIAISLYNDEETVRQVFFGGARIHRIAACNQRDALSQIVLRQFALTKDLQLLARLDCFAQRTLARCRKSVVVNQGSQRVSSLRPEGYMRAIDSEKPKTTRYPAALLGHANGASPG